VHRWVILLQQETKLGTLNMIFEMNMNIQTWKCGEKERNDVIATLNGTTLTFNGKVKCIMD